MHTASSALCLLVALATTGEIASASDVATEVYTVEAKLVSLPAGEAKDLSPGAYYSAPAVADVINRPHVSVLSFPSVTAKKSVRSAIDCTQLTKFADGTEYPTGPCVTISPRSPGFTAFDVDFREISRPGYTDGHATHSDSSSQPIKTTVKATVAAEPRYALVSLPVRSTTEVYDANGRVMASVADANERQLLFVKITRG